MNESFFLPVTERRTVQLPPFQPLAGATPGERMALSAHLTRGLTAGMTLHRDDGAEIARKALADGLHCREAGQQGPTLAIGPRLSLLDATGWQQAAAALDEPMRLVEFELAQPLALAAVGRREEGQAGAERVLARART